MFSSPIEALIRCLWNVSQRELSAATRRGVDTILNQDAQALLDEKSRVEDDQSEAERQHIVAGSDLEEGSYDALRIVIVSACKEAQ